MPSLEPVEVRTEEQIEVAETPPQLENVQYHHANYEEALGIAGSTERPGKPIETFGPKVGRNDACPCGSGKKYKHCHGRLN